jgi:uncharacterized protein YneF (UPF0154 family)
MDNKVSNYLRWIVVIGFLVLPPFLVRNFPATAPAIRIVAYCLLTIALGAFGLYLTFKPRDIVADMPIAKELKTEKSKNVVALFFRGLAALAAITGLFLLVYVARPVFSYELTHAPPVTEQHVVNHINSAAMPGAFFIHMQVQTDDTKSLSFWYPDTVLQAGHRYTFTLLPDSNFVLSAQFVE